MNVSGNTQVAILRTVIPHPNGAKVVYTTVQGAYLGTIVFDASNLESLVALGNDFQAFCAQQGSAIQVAGAGALAGLKLSS